MTYSKEEDLKEVSSLIKWFIDIRMDLRAEFNNLSYSDRIFHIIALNKGQKTNEFYVTNKRELNRYFRNYESAGSDEIIIRLFRKVEIIAYMHRYNIKYN